MLKAITVRSISILKKKTGMVIFVGIAARLVINYIAMAAIERPQSTILFPPKKTAKRVNGVSTQP